MEERVATTVDTTAQLRRALARLEATAEVARAVGGETRLERVLETIVKRGRALIEARSMIVVLEQRDGGLVVAATAGEFEGSIEGISPGEQGSAWRRVMADRRAERIGGVSARLGISLRELGVDASAALLAPLGFRGRSLGVLAAFDSLGDAPEFDQEDEDLLTAFAASAATAVATAQSVAEGRLRDSIEVAERERARWARELHDETLQGLGALRVMLASALRMEEDGGLPDAVRGAVQQIEDQIASLRSLITELRPAALDELGLGAAVESLAETQGAAGDLEIHLDLALAREDGITTERLDREVESAIYRVVQEALTNVSKHARADQVWIELSQDDESVLVVVRDDGVGFENPARAGGFGLVGMRERVALTGGSLAIVSAPGAGTELRGRIPVNRAVGLADMVERRGKLDRRLFDDD